MRAQKASAIMSMIACIDASTDASKNDERSVITSMSVNVSIAASDSEASPVYLGMS